MHQTGRLGGLHDVDDTLVRGLASALMITTAVAVAGTTALQRRGDSLDVGVRHCRTRLMTTSPAVVTATFTTRRACRRWPGRRRSAG